MFIVQQIGLQSLRESLIISNFTKLECEEAQTVHSTLSSLHYNKVRKLSIQQKKLGFNYNLK